MSSKLKTLTEAIDAAGSDHLAIYNVLEELKHIGEKKDLERKFKLVALKHFLRPHFPPEYNGLVNVAMFVGISPAEIISRSALSIASKAITITPSLLHPNFIHLVDQNLFRAAYLSEDIIFKLMSSGLIDALHMDIQLHIYCTYMPAFDHLVIKSFSAFLNGFNPPWLLYKLVRYTHAYGRFKAFLKTRLKPISFICATQFECKVLSFI